MGMFDLPKKFTDDFEEGQVFTLQEAKVGNELNTEYGPRTPVLLKINGAWYSIFGDGIANQVDRQASGDLPAKVYVGRVPTKGGSGDRAVKLLIPEGVTAEEMAEAVS